jgi:hypothetical protein
MKRELQRLASEGQRRQQQRAEADRQAAEVQRQERIKALQPEARNEVKRLKDELRTAAEAGKTSHVFRISCTEENVVFDAVVRYCEKHKLNFTTYMGIQDIEISW